MENRKYISRNQYISETFIQMPRWLMDSPEFSYMSNDAKVLYAYLKNLINLSVQNDKFKDEREIPFVKCSRKTMEAILCKSDKTVKKAVDELLNAGLIEEKRFGQGKTNHIYVLMPETFDGYKEKSFVEDDDDLYETVDCYEEEFKNRNSSEPRTVNSPIQETEDFRWNNNNSSNNKRINKNLGLNNSIYESLFDDEKMCEYDGMILTERQMNDLNRLVKAAGNRTIDSCKENIINYIHKLHDNGFRDSKGEAIKSLYSYVCSNFQLRTQKEMEEKVILERLANEGDQAAKRGLGMIHV